MDTFKEKFLEIKEELKALNPNNESIVDGVIAPIFFVVLANFVELNIAIYSTAILLTSLLVLTQLLRVVVLSVLMWIKVLVELQLLLLMEE